MRTAAFLIFFLFWMVVCAILMWHLSSAVSNFIRPY